VPVHAFSLARGADLQLQLFTASSLDESVFKFTIRQLYKRRLNPRHSLNRRRCAFQNCAARFGCNKILYTKRNQNKSFFCPNQYLVITLKEFRLQQNFVHQKESKQILFLPKPISCHYIERSTEVSTRKIKGTSAVNLCYGSHN